MDEQSDSRKVKKPRRPKGSGGIRNRGSERHPRWFAYHEVVVDGQTRQVTRGPFPRKKDAENWLKDELQRVREGRPTLPSKITVAELLAEWLAARKPSLEPNTFREYDRIAEHRIKPLIGHHKVRDLRPGHVSKMFDELRKPGGNRRGRQDRGLSETSLQHTHTVLRSAIEHAIRQRVVTYNVMDDVDRPRRDRKRMRVWSAAELAAFLDHAASSRLFPLLRLASHSGARRSELLGLRWTDVDLEAGSISVASRRTRVGYQMVERPGTKTVAGSRVIDLDPDTTAILRRWRDTQDAERSAWGVACVTSGYVFTNEDGSAVHADHVANRFERLVAGSTTSGTPTPPCCSGRRSPSTWSLSGSGTHHPRSHCRSTATSCPASSPKRQPTSPNWLFAPAPLGHPAPASPSALDAATRVSPGRPRSPAGRPCSTTTERGWPPTSTRRRPTPSSSSPATPAAGPRRSPQAIGRPDEHPPCAAQRAAYLPDT
jgi:integrase